MGDPRPGKAVCSTNSVPVWATPRSFPPRLRPHPLLRWPVTGFSSAGPHGVRFLPKC